MVASRNEYIDFSWIEPAKKTLIALEKQIENTEKHIERLNQKLIRYACVGLPRALIAIEVASCQETLAILKSIRDGKETPLS
jgi:hypothetical protein